MSVVWEAGRHSLPLPVCVADRPAVITKDRITLALREDHETVFETAQERRAMGKPVGEDFKPLAQVPPTIGTSPTTPIPITLGPRYPLPTLIAGAAPVSTPGPVSLLAPDLPLYRPPPPSRKVNPKFSNIVFGKKNKDGVYVKAPFPAPREVFGRRTSTFKGGRNKPPPPPTTPPRG